MRDEFRKTGRKMADIYKQVGDWFWHEKFWLPTNRTWEQIYSYSDKHPELHIPKTKELYVVIPYALVIIFIRYLWERFIAYPIGHRLGVKDVQPRKVEPNPVLETAFKQHNKILKSHVSIALSKQMDMSVRQIERWWRKRRLQGKPSEMKRFSEASWRCMFYFVAFYYGVWTLWDKEWLWDLSYVWIDYPFQPVATDVYWYYMIELSFYISLLMSLFIDNKRKDFYESVIHHFTTVSLMVISWTCTYTRLGTMLLIVHDATDYLMEGAKIANYVKYQKTCDTLFVMFAVSWLIARIIYFPFWVVRSSLMGHIHMGYNLSDVGGIYVIGNGLILILMVLNFIWFSTIVKMVYYYVVKGEVEKDDRSESDCGSDTESDTDINLNGITNNAKATNHVTRRK